MHICVCMCVCVRMCDIAIKSRETELAFSYIYTWIVFVVVVVFFSADLWVFIAVVCRSHNNDWFSQSMQYDSWRMWNTFCFKSVFHNVFFFSSSLGRHQSRLLFESIAGCLYNVIWCLCIHLIHKRLSCRCTCWYIDWKKWKKKLFEKFNIRP